MLADRSMGTDLLSDCEEEEQSIKTGQPVSPVRLIKVINILD